MTLNEIKSAVVTGNAVHWATRSYRVRLDSIGQWLIVCDNGYAIGLTHSDGVTLNGRPEEFFIG